MKLVISSLLVFFFSVIEIHSQQKIELKLDFNSRKNMYGFKDQKNKLIIEHKYTFVEPFKEELALVEEDLKFGYINKNDEFAILPKFADAGSFYEDFAYFSFDQKKYGYINKDGNVIIEPKFDRAFEFKNGYAKVLKLNTDTSKFGKFTHIEGLIDKSGNLIGNKWFSELEYPSDSIVNARIKNDKFTLNILNGQLQEIILSDTLSNKKKSIVDVMPEFPGGDIGLKKYIASNVRYPKSAKINKIQGKTYIRFAVSETGNITDVTITKSIHPLLAKESIRVIKSLPRWKPGIQNGKTVRVWYTVPLNFQLN